MVCPLNKKGQQGFAAELRAKAEAHRVELANAEAQAEFERNQNASRVIDMARDEVDRIRQERAAARAHEQIVNRQKITQAQIQAILKTEC